MLAIEIKGSGGAAGVMLALLDRLLHRSRIPYRFWWRICDAYDLSLGTPDTPENFPRRWRENDRDS